MLNFSFAFVAVCGTKLPPLTALLIAPLIILSLTAVVLGVQVSYCACAHQVESAHCAASMRMRNLQCDHSAFIGFVGSGYRYVLKRAADNVAQMECRA